jgi:ATP-GRASP peptide maturase of grasp-with-spasm system
MMVLILSTQSFEYSTDLVIDWLYYYEIKFHRLNSQQISKDFNISMFLSSEQDMIKPSFLAQHYSVLWFRKWNIKNEPTYLIDYINSLQYKSITQHLYKEIAHYSNAIFNQISYKYAIDDINTVLTINKLNVLNAASQCGLKIPDTLVTSNKEEIKQFLIQKKQIITKPISEATAFENNGELLLMYTSEINFDNFGLLKDSMLYSLFQEKIEKKYEIRVFVLNKECYSMAIFSQDNAQTSVDFRNYDNLRPNRNVPYLLPKGVKRKILNLMKKINLNNASIDLIKSTNGKYYFLEVNPVGQFNMISKPCNYHLEKIFANFMKEKI